MNDKDLYSKIIEGNLIIPDHVPSGPRSIILKNMNIDADLRPTAQELWTDPWLQNVNPAADQVLLTTY
jgi:hypothetical protein